MKCPVCKQEFRTHGSYSQHMKKHVRNKEATAIEKLRPEKGSVTWYLWGSPDVYVRKHG